MEGLCGGGGCGGEGRRQVVERGNTKNTGGCRCSCFTRHITKKIPDTLEDYGDFPAPPFTRGHEEWRRRAKLQCPLGFLTLMIVRLLHCVLREELEGCFHPYSVLIREEIKRTDFKAFLGSEWPVFALLNTVPWRNWPGFDLRIANSSPPLK